jgi:glycosyltransferase involved in cell wall biosynthesis
MSRRLIIVTHNIIKGDGQGRVALAIAERALKEGWKVDLLADRVEAEAIQNGARQIPIPFGPLARKAILMKVIEGRRFADSYLTRHRADYDVILGYGHTLTIPHHLSNAQFCHSAWADYVAHSGMAEASAKSPYQRLYTAYNRWGEKKSFGQAKRIVCCSFGVKRELMGIGIPEEKLEVIFNGADPAEFLPQPLPRAPLGLPEGVVLGVFAGDIRSARKNLESVLRAMVAVPDCHLAVVGASEESPYPAMAAQLGITERVHFLGFRRDVASVFRASDFFVFPSRYEPFGMVALEAAFCGLPLILPECVGAIEAVRDATLVIDTPENIPALTGAMTRLTRDPELRRTLGQRGLEARDRCNWTTLTDRWMQLLNEA